MMRRATGPQRLSPKEMENSSRRKNTSMSIIKETLLLAESESLLSEYDSITLPELEADHLMSRFDEKYVFHVSKLSSFLSALKKDYKVLSVNNQKMPLYENIYFDTPDLKSYHD